MTDNTQVTPAVWDVLMVVSVTDGDTLRLIRKRPIELDGRRYQITDDEPRGVPHRLAWVDTPERGDTGWLEAKLDLRHWVDISHGPLTAYVYGSAGWDRLLVDLQDAEGRSASQYLMAERGWPPYSG